MNTKTNNAYLVKFLADLPQGEEAVITKVLGHGSFRSRITEMGFVKGQKVKVIRNAPLRDPIEYEIMGYNISLRRSEASLIEVISPTMVAAADELPSAAALSAEPSADAVECFLPVVHEKVSTINIALVGNPNSGKTTLYNAISGAHEKVGNYGGVTVDAKAATVRRYGYTYHLFDLPGTYSIAAYTQEELYVRQHIMDNMPDVVINVVDATNLERNLFLTTQLIDMNIKVIIALNMFDELEKTHTKLDYIGLGKMLGIPIVPTVASKGAGIEELLKKVIDCYEDNEPTLRHIHINYGASIEGAIDKVKQKIVSNPELPDRYCIRNLAIKLLEQDAVSQQIISRTPNCVQIMDTAAVCAAELEKEFKDKPGAVLSDAKYGFIAGALKRTLQKGTNSLELSSKIDAILVNKYLGFPIFIAFMWAIFQITFSLGAYPMDWIETAITLGSDALDSALPAGIFKDMLLDGIVAGVGGVLVFLPNILILFFFISFMEDTGYMARASFIMDKLMQKINLHGKSFIPLMIGFGCGVPAIMATRTLSNRRDRILTTLMIPFISCSARLPVYILLIGAFFPSNQGLMLVIIYAIGILIAIASVYVISRYFLKNVEAPFVMELPPYRIPTMKNTYLHMWHRAVQYLRKMGSIILVASVIVWAMGYFPLGTNYSQDYAGQLDAIAADAALSEADKATMADLINIQKHYEQQQSSYIGQFGRALEPAIAPLGFDWKLGVGIISGFMAKEIIVSTMGVLLQTDDTDGGVTLQTKLQEQRYADGPRAGQQVITPVVAFGFMVFVLLYVPCVAALAAIKREIGTKWAVLVLFYNTAVAWLVAFGVFQIGSAIM